MMMMMMFRWLKVDRARARNILNLDNNDQQTNKPSQWEWESLEISSANELNNARLDHSRHS